MKVVITGGAGFLGQALAADLLARGSLIGQDGTACAIDEIISFDSQALRDPPSASVSSVVGDITNADAVRELLDHEDCSVFHLASVVSHGAEQDFDLALDVNLRGGLNVLEACRALPSTPRLVFASSFASYGGEQPPFEVDDETRLTPRTTYGATKAIVELLVNDYSRKGFLDGRTARLPTVVIRPGQPNLAASSWCSSIFREPLAGRDYELPVSRETRTTVIGARTAVDGLVRLHDLASETLGPDRAVLFPGLSVTAAQMIESVERVGAGRLLGEIGVAVDPAVEAIVRTWPTRLGTDRASRLGIPADPDLDSIVAAYLEDSRS